MTNVEMPTETHCLRDVMKKSRIKKKLDKN